MRRRTWIAAVATPVLTAALAITGIALANSAQASTTRNMLVTLYGWPDNSPPGDGTAFGSGHAGGTGTFSNPVTFATDQDEFAPGTKVYYPFLHRYFIMQDECVECDQDWANGKFHIDLWVGGKGGNTNAVINCEDDLTKDSGQVVVDPPSNEPVDTTPLFNSGTNKCYDPGSFGGGGGGGGGGSGNAFVGAGSGKCIDDPKSSTTNGTQMEIWSCNGGANQKFSYNSSNGTIVGSQSGKCVTVKSASTANGAGLILYTCNGGGNQKWTRQ